MKDDEENPTSHLLGLFYRTIHLKKIGVKPLWVFDGVPSELKLNELRRRKKLKEEA